MDDNDRKFFREHGFGRKIGFGGSPAVLVIDFMNSFTSPSHSLGSNMDAEIAATLKVLKAGRSSGVPIFFTIVQYEDTNLSDAGVWSQKITGLNTLICGSDDVRIDQRLGRKENESVIVKKYASSFFGTDLVSRLNALSVDTLIITGCTTSGCVRATVVDGLQYGYRCIIVEEAVGDRIQNAHDQSLVDMDAKYGDVISLKNTLNYLATI